MHTHKTKGRPAQWPRALKEHDTVAHSLRHMELGGLGLADPSPTAICTGLRGSPGAYAADLLVVVLSTASISTEFSAAVRRLQHSLLSGPQMTRSSGASEVMHAGRKSQFCSFAGSMPGRFFCAWLTPQTKRKTRRTSTAIVTHAAVAASERAMKMRARGRSRRRGTRARTSGTWPSCCRG